MLKRFASSIAVGTLVAVALGAGATAPALAQDLQLRSQFIINHVKPEARQAYEQWVADYRALVEKLIANGQLIPEAVCAFRSWRVLVPPAEMAEQSEAAGLPHDYIFIFDPIIDGVSYSLQDYLVAGLGETEAMAKLTEYQSMLASGPTLAVGAPMTGADAIDRTGVC